MGFFLQTLKIAGYPMGKAQEVHHHIVSLKGRNRGDHVTQQRQKILEYHYANNAFYRDHICKGTKLSQWEEIPVMLKSDLQRPLEERLSHGFRAKELYVGKTSGSSGTPTIFARDKFTHAMIWTNVMMEYQQHGIDYSNDYEARFYGINLSKPEYTIQRIKDWLANRYRFVIFDLSPDVLDRFVQKFRSNKFKFIYGYTNSIVRFAKHLRDKNINIKSVCPTLRLCIVTSEMLTDPDRQLLEEVFDVPVINEYGCSEVDVVAFQQPDNTWLLNDRTAYVEITDDEGKSVPHGSAGNITVTSLYNRAHPFIRYQVGDHGIISPESEPGRNILQSLTGRTNDMAIMPSGREVPGYTFVYITKSVTNQSGKVKEIRITQKSATLFEIDYSADGDLTIQEEQAIKNSFDKYLEPGVQINLNRLDFIPRAKSGKLKQFTSEL
jgi:phenylacetate-CoA ligase